MQMSCQLQAAASLPLKGKLSYPLCGRLSGTHIRISFLWRRQKPQTLLAGKRTAIILYSSPYPSYCNDRKMNMIL